MYQILERSQLIGHAHSDLYQTEGFFLGYDNAVAAVERLCGKLFDGVSFYELVSMDEDGNHVYDWVHYKNDEMFKIVKIVPFEEIDISLPF